jgi:hypothetical protein
MSELKFDPLEDICILGGFDPGEKQVPHFARDDSFGFEMSGVSLFSVGDSL